jgi:hypothetical protein
MLFEEAYSCQS